MNSAWMNHDIQQTAAQPPLLGMLIFLFSDSVECSFLCVSVIMAIHYLVTVDML